MMQFTNRTLIVLMIFSFGSLFGQQKPAELVKTFFEDFHRQDTTQLSAHFTSEAVMKSISKDENGQTRIASVEIDRFVRSIGSIPSDRKFEEKILSYEVQEDDLMAQVWTPYEFYINQKLSHTGVNVFVLSKVNEEWKIVFLIDTRYR